MAILSFLARSVIPPYVLIGILFWRSHKQRSEIDILKDKFKRMAAVIGRIVKLLALCPYFVAKKVIGK